ncbi:MAG: hypothetical protein K2O83_11455, partial [Schaedlerella arabinosiphila]|nr:hypothetical protein [Schaedlerella arabinosiphila]
FSISLYPPVFFFDAMQALYLYFRTGQIAQQMWFYIVYIIGNFLPEIIVPKPDFLFLCGLFLYDRTIPDF